MANDPFGRMLTLMRQQSEKTAGDIPAFQVGEMVTGAQIKVGGRTLSRDDYVIIENRFTVEAGGAKKTFRVPYKKKQEQAFTVNGSSVKVSVPALQKGDLVLCYQISDGKYAVFGRVVES